MTAPTTVTGSVNVTTGWSVSQTVTGSTPSTNSGSYLKNNKTTVSGNASGQIDTLYQTILSLNASSSTTLILTTAGGGSLKDLLGNTISFTRVKYLVLWLLATGDTGPDNSTTGTACTNVTIGGAGTHPAFEGASKFWSAGATLEVWNGFPFVIGNLNTTGCAITSTTDQFLIVNADSVNAAALVVTIGGTVD